MAISRDRIRAEDRELGLGSNCLGVDSSSMEKLSPLLSQMDVAFGMTINIRFQGLCQMYKGRRWDVGVGCFRYGEEFWEEVHTRVHDRAQEIRVS